VSSHLLGEVARVADDVVILADGRLVTQAPMAELAGVGSEESEFDLEELFLELTGDGGRIPCGA
jgi:ABC-type Na+ transport system ATPase subunit NatA